MRRGLTIVFCMALGSTIHAAEPADHPTTYDGLIARLAKVHGVPESFVHRIVKRESRYQPRVMSKGCFGLMQLKHKTARSMGYEGSPQGLLDPRVNLTYGIPYLANAYKVAEGDSDLAVKLYASGYYFTAKRKNMLGELRTALSDPLVAEREVALEPPAAVPESPPTGEPFGTLFSFLGEPSPSTPAEPTQ